MATVLVTGGAGYVGSHTIVELLANDFAVVAVDNLVNSYAQDGQVPESLKRVQTITNKTVKFYDTDIRNGDALDKIFKQHKIDCVIHFAALKAVGESCQIPLTYYQNNITGSSTLFEVMSKNDVKKLVFSSSATVYGTPKSLPITEDHVTGQGCTNPYGKTKYFVEEILKDVSTSDKDWAAILLRYFNPVGAHKSGLIGEDPAGRRNKLQVFGNDYPTKDGTGVRDYIHVTDLALGHLKALDKILDPNFTGCKAYNLGTGQGYSVLEVIDAFQKASGKEIKYEIVERRAGDVASSYADARLASDELGWRAEKNLLDMCTDTWRWQSMNPNGFQN